MVNKSVRATGPESMSPNGTSTRSAGIVLRRGVQEMRLGEGDCFIGREPDCEICLDNPLISRKHAKITVEKGAATIVDLASANGVYVNGLRVRDRTPLTEGDHVLIGEEEILVTYVGELANPAGTPTLRDTLRLAPDISVPHILQGLDATGRVDTFALISRVVDRVLAEGRAADAERMLSPQLDILLREVTRRGSLPEATANRATEYAIKLAAATRRAKWIDYVIHLHTAMLRPLPSGAAASLVSAAQNCGEFDRAAVRSYVVRLLSSAERLSPAERTDLEALGALAGGPASQR